MARESGHHHFFRQNQSKPKPKTHEQENKGEKTQGSAQDDTGHETRHSTYSPLRESQISPEAATTRSSSGFDQSDTTPHLRRRRHCTHVAILELFAALSRRDTGSAARLAADPRLAAAAVFLVRGRRGVRPRVVAHGPRRPGAGETERFSQGLAQATQILGGTFKSMPYGGFEGFIPSYFLRWCFSTSRSCRWFEQSGWGLLLRDLSSSIVFLRCHGFGHTR